MMIAAFTIKTHTHFEISDLHISDLFIPVSAKCKLNWAPTMNTWSVPWKLLFVFVLHWWGCIADGYTFSCPPSPTLPQCLAGTGAWQRINTAVKLHSPRYPVFDLQDGQKYQFRVYSVNMYGSSEASVPSEPIQKVDEDGKGWDLCRT